MTLRDASPCAVIYRVVARNQKVDFDSIYLLYHFPSYASLFTIEAPRASYRSIVNSLRRIIDSGSFDIETGLCKFEREERMLPAQCDVCNMPAMICTLLHLLLESLGPVNSDTGLCVALRALG